MKYSVVITLAVVAIIVAVFAIIVLIAKPGSEVTTVVEDVATEGVGTKDVEALTGTDSLLALQAMNKNLECQIIYTANDGKEVEGTYFISEGKMRGDFLVPAPEFGGELLSSIIVDGPMMYVWSQIGDETYGFKSDRNTPPKDRRVESKEPVPLDTDVKYSCTDWQEVDGSVFVPPQTVEFKDLGSMIEAGGEFPEF
ncbi:MAG TPA: hypothetical protein VGE31_01785 [Candidatus Paceibacterota bacterium]